MAEINIDQVREGMPVYDMLDRNIGAITEVCRDVPNVGMTVGIGYIRVEQSVPTGEKILDIPFTQILEVLPDKVVVELNPDRVAAHYQQVVPELPHEQDIRPESA